MEDWDVIERCRSGEPDSFRHLVKRYETQAWGHALTILRCREDAADAVQTAFVQAFAALDRFEVGRRFYPWFYTILRNCCLKLAARRPPPSCEVDDDSRLLAPAGDDEAESRMQLLERALWRLTPEDRELITLKHLDGCRYAELAERLNIPPGTVMSRLYHARQRLREQMQSLLKGSE